MWHKPTINHWELMGQKGVSVSRTVQHGFQVMIISYIQRKYRLKNICNIAKTIKHTEKLYRMYILFLCYTLIQSTYRSGWFWQRTVGLANRIPKPEIQKKIKVDIKTFKKASSWETPTTLWGAAVPRSSSKLEWLSVKRSWVKESRRMWFLGLIRLSQA